MDLERLAKIFVFSTGASLLEIYFTDIPTKKYLLLFSLSFFLFTSIILSVFFKVRGYFPFVFVILKKIFGVNLPYYYSFDVLPMRILGFVTEYSSLKKILFILLCSLLVIRLKDLKANKLKFVLFLFVVAFLFSDSFSTFLNIVDSRTIVSFSTYYVLASIFLLIILSPLIRKRLSEIFLLISSFFSGVFLSEPNQLLVFILVILLLSLAFEYEEKKTSVIFFVTGLLVGAYYHLMVVLMFIFMVLLAQISEIEPFKLRKIFPPFTSVIVGASFILGFSGNIYGKVFFSPESLKFLLAILLACIPLFFDLKISKKKIFQSVAVIISFGLFHIITGGYEHKYFVALLLVSIIPLFINVNISKYIFSLYMIKVVSVIAKM